MNGDQILHAAAASPWWLHAGADLLLILHVGGALVALAAGGVALTSRKGSRLHRGSGNVFFAAMLVMASVAAGVAPFLPRGQWSNTTAAVLSLYLVTTAWMTARRPAGSTGAFEIGAFAFSSALAAMGIVLLFTFGATPRAASFGGVYVTCFLSGIGAAGDLWVIRHGGITGPRRTARHVWRMCLPMFVVVGSAFVGQQDELPVFMHGSPVLFAPMVGVFGLMVWWLYRLRPVKALA